MTDRDAAWLAGLLEGEGCFTLRSGKYPEMKLNMCDEDIVQRVADLWGGRPVYTLTRRPGHTRSTFSTVIRGTQALDTMRRVLPDMGLRRQERIEEILSLF